MGVNQPGTAKQGHSIDGVLPDDQRRGGSFQWPPPKENYVYEALQGALAQAVILHNAGYDVWNWEDRALLRAFQWLHEQAEFPAEGDDTWQPHLVNFYYGTRFPAPIPSRPGKNVGWTDWTHGPPASQDDRTGRLGQTQIIRNAMESRPSNADAENSGPGRNAGRSLSKAEHQAPNSGSEAGP